ncbi:MAG: rod shape-determining protein MreD [Candidatus Cloacimonetes bacterium]|nr:rod shape-determining protein MreD [Candidatus Cloacimonadota bacterium]
MKVFKMILLGVFILYLQLIIAPYFTIYSIIPNFFIAYFAFAGIRINAKSLFPIAFFLGLALDVMYPPLLGLNSIAFIIIVYFVCKFQTSINKQRFIIVSLSILFLNFLYYIIFYLYHLFASQNLESFFLYLLLSIFYNTFVSILIIYILSLSEKIKISINV